MMRTCMLTAALAAGGLALMTPTPATAGVSIGVGVGPVHGGYTPVYHRGYRHGGYYAPRRYHRPPVRVYVAPRRVYVAPRPVYVAPRYYGGDGCETIKTRVWNGYGYETVKRRRCY